MKRINWKILEKHKRNFKNHLECAWCGGSCTSKEADAEWVKVTNILFAAESLPQQTNVNKARVRYLRKRINRCYV